MSSLKNLSDYLYFVYRTYVAYGKQNLSCILHYRNVNNFARNFAKYDVPVPLRLKSLKNHEADPRTVMVNTVTVDTAETRDECIPFFLVEFCMLIGVFISKCALGKSSFWSAFCNVSV